MISKEQKGKPMVLRVDNQAGKGHQAWDCTHDFDHSRGVPKAKMAKSGGGGGGGGGGMERPRLDFKRHIGNVTGVNWGQIREIASL